MGLEGIVAKRRDRPYRSGRSPGSSRGQHFILVVIVERLVDDAIQKRRFALIYQKSILRTQLVHANVECNPFYGRSTLCFHSRRVSR
jgi:hypothetical protein